MWMMFYLRPLTPFGKVYHRFYSTTLRKPCVIKELVKTVDSYSKIYINSDIHVKIRPYNVLECQDSNLLRATLTALNDTSNNCSDIKLEVKISGKTVEISNKATGKESSELTCVLEVPIKADLCVDSKESISVRDMCSDNVKVFTAGNIDTTNLRSTLIHLTTENGKIDCSGLLLGKEITIETKISGNVFLDKVQGDLMTCKTIDGNIITNSCYAKFSKFSTDSGNLNLKNVHKNSEIYIQKKGDLTMTGVHGNIQVKSSGGKIDLQLSEIIGENTILANGVESAVINISDLIEETSYIKISSKNIILESALSHLSDCLEEHTVFQMSSEQDNLNKLIILTKGELVLGKLSWAESVKIAMGIKDM